jgi:hypothetical protein
MRVDHGVDSKAALLGFTRAIARGFFGAPAGIFEIARAITVISRDRYEPAGQLALYEYRSGVDL